MANNDKIINVCETIGTAYSTTGELGNIIYREVISCLSEDMVVYLDFAGLKLITVPFLEAVIGRIYKEIKDDKVLKNLRIKNYPIEKRNILGLVINNAKSYRKNPKYYMKAANEILG